MYFVASPARAVFLPVACLMIVRRIDEKRCRGNIWLFAPMDLAILNAVVLYPDATEHINCRNFAQPRRSSRIKQVGEESPPILSNRFCHCQTTLLTLRKELLFDAMAIAAKPDLITVLQQPVSGHNSQTVQGKTH